MIRGQKKGAGRGVGMFGGLRRNQNKAPCKTGTGPGYGKGAGQGKGVGRADSVQPKTKK